MLSASLTTLRKTEATESDRLYMGAFDYLRERKMVILNLPRQTGKTTAICNSAVDGDLIVFSHRPMAAHAEREFNLAARRIGVMSLASNTNHMRGREFPEAFTIWFDECQPHEVIKWMRDNQDVLAPIRALQAGNVSIVGAVTAW